MSRRSVLELGVASLAALVTPLGCDEPAQAKSKPAKPPKPIASALPSVTGPETKATPCHSTDVPLGTEVPFHPKDRAFEADSADFQPKRAPQPGDWMARFHETGMSFDEYVASRPTQRQGARNVLVLQPLGSFHSSEREQLKELATYTEAFFDTKVRLAPTAPLPKAGRRSRQGENGQWIQHHTERILNTLIESHLPEDAVCVLGVTLEDLYPEPSWNYVFGEASLEQRVGVYSLARYQARFWGGKETRESRRLALLRSFKVLAHETGHLFSLPHCRRFECLMNGSNSLDEMDRQPLEPCCVCLKMLAYNLRFDIQSRYRRLMTIYERNGLSEQRDWVKTRLSRIGCA
jgi:archaemetzincin